MALDGGKAPGQAKTVRPALVVAVAAVVVACVGAGILCLFSAGVLAPAGAAAKHSFLSYVWEDETTDYIMTYKEQMGYGDASDEEWAGFLATYNLTPERLRYSTVDQLISDVLIEDWGKRLNIEVSDADLDAYVQSMRNVYAFDSDEIWKSTLEQYGRTEDQLRDTYRHGLVRQRVFSEEVPMPQVDDAQLQERLYSVVSAFNSSTVKHSYCFKISGLDEEGSFEKRARVENARKALIETGVDKEGFEALVTTLSDVDSLVTTGGANGWSCDASEYSDKYLEALEVTAVGDVSNIFVDGDGYAFIWVDQEIELPATQEEAQGYDIASLPESLHDYLADSVAYMLWQQDCDTWLNGQVADANVTLFPMPADVPYNVDMSLAGEQQ